MSSITKYESLKIDGTWQDRLQYILSLPDKNEIENHLKESLTSSYDDLQTFVFLSTSRKNERNLLEIFTNNHLPVKQRAFAGKSWMMLQKDEKQTTEFLLQSMKNENLPRYLKCQLLKSVHRIDCVKKSSSFFFDLVSRLTETNDHQQYNIDAHLVPFCTKEQIFNLLSRWSIERLEQIDSSSAFFYKLVRYQPLVLLHLMKEDLKKKKKTNSDQFTNYFREKATTLESIAIKHPKELVRFAIDYVNQFEKHKQFFPQLIQTKQKYFFDKAPEEMIELITIVATNQPGHIKYRPAWGNDGYDLTAFSFPRSFSVENYVRLFDALYKQCNWGANDTIRLLQLLLGNQSEHSDLYSIKKRKEWFVKRIVNERIGKDLFLKKLLKEGDENTLELLDFSPELTTPLSRHLLSRKERDGIVSAKQRLGLIRYQTMTEELFQEFLSLFKQTGSDVNQRQLNYCLFLQCANARSEQFVQTVLQWIEKRFANEQLTVIEYFISQLSSLDYRFQLKFLPKTLQSIENIIQIAINHLQNSANTFSTIGQYGLFLLQRAEFHRNEEEKKKIQSFASKIIKQCYLSTTDPTFALSPIPEVYSETRQILANIFVSDVYPTLLSKSRLDELHSLLRSPLEKVWRLPQIDSFLQSFFTEFLPSSKKLQSAFRLDQHTSLISYYLKKKSTQLERVKQLIENIGSLFFLNNDVQRIVLRSQQYRSFIDRLIEDNKSFTLEKLPNEQSLFSATLSSTTKNTKFPGLNIDLLNSSSQQLTGKQQQHITQIILNDYLQDKEVRNLDKLKALRVLRRLTQTYNETIQWLKKNDDSSLLSNNAEVGGGRSGRGVPSQSLDDIILCLPSTFDLTPQNLLEHFNLLASQLKASNAKYISDAMWSIARKVPDQTFLKGYLDFIRHEQFQKLGITANKEVLRLLVEYKLNPSLIRDVFKPLWDSHPHQDVRACLIGTLLHFLGPNTTKDDQTVLWTILEEAAVDEYLPVVQTLLTNSGTTTRGPLSQLKTSSNDFFETFVNRIQMKVLDHPKSLEARSWAWSNVDYEYCPTKKLVEKAQQLCIQFDKDARTLWKHAFDKIILLYKHNKISSIDVIKNVIEKIMLLREEIDSKESGLDDKHDLPVYHRLKQLLSNLDSHINDFDQEKKVSFRSLTSMILQFDLTFAFRWGTLLIKICQNKEDLENVLKTLQESLPENYFQRILTQLSVVINTDNACAFIQQFNADEKLHLAQWFVQEKHRDLLMWDFLKDKVFNQNGVDLEQRRNLLRQFRQNENLFLRQQAMMYTVPWKEDGGIVDDDQMDVEENDDEDTSDM